MDRDEALAKTIDTSAPSGDADICRDIRAVSRTEGGMSTGINAGEFRALAENIPTLCWIAEADGWIFWYNRRWYEYTGTTREQMEGWGWQSVHDPVALPAVLERWQASIASGQPFEMVFPLRGTDGNFRPFLTRIQPFRDGQGKIVRWFGVNSDISEQLASERARAQLAGVKVELEAIVAERTAELRESNEEMQRYAYIVSHDLRAPLVNITGFTSELEILRNELLDAGAKPAGDATRERTLRDYDESLGFIKAAIGKMDRLIGAILKLSREGRRTFRPEPLAMTALMNSLADAQRHQADAARAVVEISALPDISADRLAVEQIFGNLIDNAIKYLEPTRPGRIEITGEDRGTRVAYRVRDNGRGIAAEDHARVFELFRRAGRQDQVGEGIGLAHVKALVRSLGGSIELESEPGASTTFSVILPKRFAARQDR